MIKFFLVGTEKEIQNKSFSTLTYSYKEACEYVVRRSVFDNKEHFENWCSIHNLELSPQTIIYYYNRILPIRNKYIIQSIKYSKKQLASLLRIFANCIPIGCSFETTDEQFRIIEKYNEEILKQLDKELNNTQTETTTTTK